MFATMVYNTCHKRTFMTHYYFLCVRSLKGAVDLDSFHVAVVLIPNTIQCRASLQMIRYICVIFCGKFLFSDTQNFKFSSLFGSAKNIAHICLFYIQFFSTLNFDMQVQNLTPKYIPKMHIG